jgi:hypothetical protein
MEQIDKVDPGGLTPAKHDGTPKHLSKLDCHPKTKSIACQHSPSSQDSSSAVSVDTVALASYIDSRIKCFLDSYDCDEKLLPITEVLVTCESMSNYANRRKCPNSKDPSVDFIDNVDERAYVDEKISARVDRCFRDSVGTSKQALLNDLNDETCMGRSKKALPKDLDDECNRAVAWPVHFFSQSPNIRR